MARQPHAADLVQTDADAIEVATNAGYSSVTNVVHHGRVWIVEAVGAVGLPVVLVIHGKDGRITVGDDGTEDAS